MALTDAQARKLRARARSLEERAHSLMLAVEKAAGEDSYEANIALGAVTGCIELVSALAPYSPQEHDDE